MPSGDIEVINGGTQTFEFSSDIGYKISKLIIDGVEQEITNSYTFEDVNENHSVELICEPSYFNINASTTTGGTIYPLGDINVQQGYSQTFNFFPDDSYEVSRVLIDGVEVENKSAYTFNNVNEEHTILVEYSYVPKIFEINVTYGIGGKLNPEKTIKVIEGSEQIFTVVPDNKYELEYLSVDSENVEVINNQYVFENISDNHSIFAKFKYVPSYYIINASCNDGGKITNIGAHSYIEYSTIEYTFTPNHKYKVKNVIIDGVSHGGIEKYTFTDLSSDHTIDVEFEYVPEVFIIQTSCGENGILSQIGEIKVNEATTFTLNIQPDYGYKIKEILVDGEIVEKSNVISIENIWENHTIDVSFEPKLIYTITSSCDDNSKIYPLGEVNVYEDDGQKFEISANSGYFLKGVQVDGIDVEYNLLKTNYLFENVLENHTITVQTEKIEPKYYISSIASNHGNIEPSGINSFEFGEQVTYVFTPISGYKLNNIIVDGKVIKLSNNTYTFYNIRGNHTITANFVIDNNENTMNEVDALGLALNYDVYDRIEPSKIYLSKPNKHLLGVLNGVDEQSCNVTIRANNTSSISFNVYKEINGEESNYYNQIDALMELYVSSIGWFKITQPPEINFDGNNEMTIINAESYEIELQQYDKVGFVVNRASEDSLEMMATDNTYLDANGYKLFRDNVHFYRDTSDYKVLLNDFKSYNEDEQTLEILKLLSIDNPTFLISSWRFNVDIKAFMENLPAIKSSLSKDDYEIDYLDEFQELYGVKDSSTGESALTTSVIKSVLTTHPELIEYLPFDVNTQNISVKNKIFNNTATTSDGNFSAVLNVTNAYCIQGSEINFKVEVDGNKGDLTYKYKFGNDSNCITDYISQSSIDWTSYYDITSTKDYINIPVSVEVVDTYVDENEVKQTQKLTLSINVYVFTDNDTLSNYIIDNNIALTYEEYETYSFVELIELEMQRMKDLSLMDQILLECPSWEVGMVDDYVDEQFPEPLRNEVGAFEIDSQDIYSLLTQTMAQYFSCIFVFDTMQMTVNAYRVSGIGKDTNIHLGYRNVQNSINITPSDELYTIFNVSNGESLNLAYVNFGDREIEDISYFLNEEYLDKELIDKYKAWQEYRESFRDEYIDYSRLYNSQNETVTELYNRVPVDGLDIKQYESFSYNELDEELNNYISLIEGIKSTFKLYVNGSEYETITIIASIEPYITYEYYGLKENLEEIQKSMYWNEYRQYKEIVNNILIAMYNFGMDKDDDDYCDYIDDWQWDMVTYGYMYGLDELKAKLEVFKDGIETYKDYSLSYSNSNKTMVESTYNTKRDEYLKYKDSYDKCIIMLKERELEISVAESILNEYYEKRDEIAQKVKKTNWTSDEYPLGFTNEDLEKLGRVYKSTDYINENIIYTSISSTDDIVDKAYELYEDAIENLYANSHPRLTYSTNQDNLLANIDYSDYVNDFRLFNFIRVSIRDDYQIKLRVIEYSLNPMIHDNNLNLVFSNMIQYKSKRNDFAALLDNAISSAKNQISSLTKSSSNQNEFSFDYDLVKSLLDSRAFGSYMGSYTANNITSEALESALSNLGSISPNSAFIQYLNSNLLVTNDAYMDYLNSNLVVSNVADIRTLMFGSAVGTTLQSTFSSSVISLLEDATIKSAMIESLNASKINAGTINTNYVEISSDSGNMKIMDNTIQIKDDNDVTRVQIGKDSSYDYNMYVLDENGKVMFDATGLHEDGIKEGIIRDDMVSDDANISGSKLNIESLYSSMNDSGYSLNASNIKLDAMNQSLEVSFNTLNSKVTQQGNSISSYGTKLSVLQGQIDSKIWKSDVETLVAESETLYNLNTQFSEFEQTLEGFETTVSQTNSRIDGLGGMRNLILDSGDVKTSTSGADEFIFETSLPIKPNSEYTFVLHGFANNSDLANGGFALYFGNTLIEDKILCRTESETVIFTITSPNVIVDEYHIIFKNMPSETVLESKLEWICMYEGDASSVSDLWIPAPEDTAIMTQEAYSVATQTATDFSWLVTKDENTSEMKLTDEAVKIISEEIEFDGVVSFGTFDSATQDMLSSQIEANTNMILKLYNGSESPSYTPSTLKLNAYKGYADDRVDYSGYFKVEECINDIWSPVFEETVLVYNGWKNETNMTLPYDFYNGNSIIYNNEIHILGGGISYKSHYKFNGTEWIKLDNLPYEFESGEVVIYNDEIHILGSAHALNSCDCSTKHYKFDGDKWTEVSTLPYEFKYGSAIVCNNEIHLLGGFSNGNNHYKWDGVSWTEDIKIPYNFHWGAAVVYNDEIHILGSHTYGYYDSHYKFNGSNWSKVSTLPYGFSYGKAVVLNDKIHIIGNKYNQAYAKHHYELDLLNIENVWTINDEIPYEFNNSSVIAYNDDIYLLGGYVTDHFRSCYRYGQIIKDTSSSYLELKLEQTINTSSNKLRCSIYSKEANPILIDSITLDIVDDFSSMLSVNNNKTYVDGGNVYCATLDANAILSNNISFTGTITGGDVDGGGIIKSYNYVIDTSGLKIDLHDGIIDSKNFKVSSDGTLTCENADITGTIYAELGEIGGWSINEDMIYATKSGLSSNDNKYAFWAGETNSEQGTTESNAKYYVTHDGYLYATNAHIEGDIIANSLTLGEDFDISIDASNIDGLSSVATSGSYNDLSDKPSIPSMPDMSYYIRAGKVYSGTDSNNKSVNFSLSSNGLLTAKNAVIEGSTLTGSLNASFINVLDSVFMHCEGYEDSLWQVMKLQHYGMGDYAELLIGVSGNEDYQDFQRVQICSDVLYTGNLTYVDGGYEGSGLIECAELTCNGQITTQNLEITTGSSGITSGAFYLGSIGSSSYYINSSGNARFSTIYEGGTSLSNKYASKSDLSSYALKSSLSSYLSSGSTLSGALYLGSSSYYINGNGNGVFEKVTADHVVINNGSSGITSGSFYLGTVGSSSYYLTSSGNAHINKVTTRNLEITVGSSGITNGAFYLGTIGSSRYYFNHNGNAVFNNLGYYSIENKSSRRFKENISYKNNDYWHEKLMAIKPCTFNYKIEELKHKERIGVIAEDLVDSKFVELVSFNEDGECEAVSYVDLIIPLVSEVQLLNNKIDEQQKQINELKELVNKLLETK